MKLLVVLIFAFGVLSCKNLKDPSFKAILENAPHDIKVDSVKYFTFGLPFVKPVFAKEVRDAISEKSIRTIENIEKISDRSQINQNLREKIKNKYGLYEMNLGCMIDEQTSILSREYKEITADYLEKRNGKGWKQRMEKELSSYVEN